MGALQTRISQLDEVILPHHEIAPAGVKSGGWFGGYPQVAIGMTGTEVLYLDAMNIRQRRISGWIA